MKRKIVLTLTLTILVSALLCAKLISINPTNAVQTTVQLLWTNPMQVHDVAVSANGNYLAAVNNTGLHYFDADSPNPIWSYQPEAGTLLSVAISADGDYVVAGDTNGYLHYFNQSTHRTGSQTTPTWTSMGMGPGPVEKGTLDMSANGNYTVVGGTGISIWYYAGCIARTGPDQTPTWTRMAGVSDYRTVHISPNGKYVAGGGASYEGGFVIFFKDADTLEGNPSPTWMAQTQLTSTIMELALSDDGYAVAAIDSGPIPSTLYYWANATNLTGDPEATWTNPNAFSCVDTNGNGETVVTGGIYFTSVHYWANARTREGTQDEDWVNLTETNVYDIAISKDGSIMAVPTMDPSSGDYAAYFLTANGNIIGNITLPSFANMVSMSTAGTTVAMAGPGYDSLYLFKIETDSTPPSINDVYQQPDEDNVYPTNTVIVYANVTDDQSGVKQVILNYTTGNGTWFTQTMELYIADIWNATIPAFPYCTTITYIIIAEDNAYNTISTDELGFALQYHVIPEYTPTLLILALMTATTLTATAYKRKRK
ncbi:MAG: hypothetical protein QXN36_03610 [Candidatus Bathyarchaeia archaeon]